MWAVLRFWMNSYVLSFGVRIRFWVCRFPESWSGPDFCVAAAARRDVAKQRRQSHARILRERDERRDVRDAIAGQKRPVDGDPGEETPAAGGGGPGVTLAAAVRTHGRRVPHPTP